MTTTQAIIEIKRKVDSVTVQIPIDLAGYSGRGSGRRSAFVAGATARVLGRSREACPYDTKRGAVSYRIAWMRGFDAGERADRRKAVPA